MPTRHLVILFRKEGATNVTWFFHVDSQRQYDWWNELPLYYPGDAYVDWLGISVYGSLFPSGPILPFAEKLEASWVYTDLTALSRRPAAISEMGAVDDAAHGKAAWIRHAFAALRSGRYPRIRAATWWDMRSPPSDTRIDSSPVALAAFRGESPAASLPFAPPDLRGTVCRPPRRESRRGRSGAECA